jgi:hypothetical protein
MIQYMAGLNDWLKLNSNAIVDLVNKKYVPAEMTKEPILEELAALLMGFIIRDLLIAQHIVHFSS